MNQTEFVVSRFKYPNGFTSWRVGGWLHGVRVRKNFKTREEAAAEKAALEIRALQAASGLQSVVTSLSTDQVREAEAVFRRLEGKAQSLSFYVDFALANYREPERQKKIEDAVADYVAARKHELEQDHICQPMFDRIRWELKRLESHFAGKLVAEITSTAVVEFLELDRPSMKTYNNRRGVLSTFFKYAFQRGWIAENPILKVPHYRIRRRGGKVATFTADQAKALMEFIEDYEGGKWVPYFALCLFAGIRPGVPYGEISKFQPDAVKLNEGIIYISSTVSKVREPRKIEIQPNLAAWLRAYPLEKFPIILGNFKKRRQKFAKKVGLTHDVLRHTFISMFVAKFRSLGEAALQAGNSEAIIRKHYLDLKSKEEAEKFFNILPKRRAPEAPAPVVTSPAPSPSAPVVELPPQPPSLPVAV